MAQIKLKEVPNDVLDTIIEVQADAKKKKSICQYSLEKAVYQIVRDYNKFKKKYAANT